jgi:RimJ/RimL family protein N-acetyltransferase
MLTLAPFTMADADRLIGWVPDARFLIQWSGPQYAFPLTREQVAQTWEATQQMPPSHLMFKVQESPGGRVIGHIELLRIDRAAKRGHVARVLIGEPGFRGRGLGTELMARLVDHAFGALGLETLTLAVFAFNAPAIACYRRLGFAPVEEKTESRAFENEHWELLIMQLTKTTWLAARH